jgi:hypothetical protein
VHGFSGYLIDCQRNTGAAANHFFSLLDVRNDIAGFNPGTIGVEISGIIVREIRHSHERLMTAGHWQAAIDPTIVPREDNPN